MYEHPSLTITAMLEEQQMLNRAVERRRAILERLERQSAPRRTWLDRLRALVRRDADAAAPRITAATAGGIVERAPLHSGTATGTDVVVGASASGVDADARDLLIEQQPVDAGILVMPVR